MRKRKVKVVWLPQDLENRLGQAPLVASSGTTSSTILHFFTGNPLGDSATTEEIPLVHDFTGPIGTGAGLGDAELSLADIASSGYRLRRIVGKLSFAAQQIAAADSTTATIFHLTAGIIVRRINRSGQSEASVSGGAQQEDINVASLDNTMDPWIWRRSWNIANQLGVDPNQLSYPESNDKYGGGVMDGPHVDAKTARIIGPEERLFLDVTVEGINGASQGPPGAIIMIGDIRCLGSLRSNVGNRRNASR